MKKEYPSARINSGKSPSNGLAYEVNPMTCTARLGFTLIELLVVIAIISILMAILLPTLNRAKDSAKNIICFSNLKQLNTALNGYIIDCDGWYPNISDIISGTMLWYNDDAPLKDYFRNTYNMPGWPCQ